MSEPKEQFDPLPLGGTVCRELGGFTETRHPNAYTQFRSVQRDLLVPDQGRDQAFQKPSFLQRRSQEIKRAEWLKHQQRER